MSLETSLIKLPSIEKISVNDPLNTIKLDEIALELWI